jgi:integrase
MKINKIEKKDGTFVYRTNVYLGVDSLTGKQVRTTATGKTRKMCEIKANQAINKFIRNGSTVTREKVYFETFKDLALSWFEGYKLTVKINSINTTNSFLNVYIIPSLGKYKPEKISTILLQNIINEWAKNANTSAIRNGKREKGKSKDYKLLLNYIKRILEYGVQLGALESNVAIQVHLPKLKARNNPKLKYFTDNELKKFLGYLDTLNSSKNNLMHSCLYRFLLATGLRIGEALALNWSDINFLEQTITINKTVVRTANFSDRVQVGAKTKESNRTISFDNNTAALLNSWRKNQNKDIISISDQFVFSVDNHCYTYANELRILTKHFKNAGVNNIGFHGFRHTHASLLMNNDVNPKEIQYRLGHADYGITMNTYAHLNDEKAKDTAEKFGNILDAL